ncbi:hypothetical protein KUL17_10940 [Alteromonas sp. KUL17]|uniref:hypothetical protein n=1 Tax=Alteromonas sp. KUL17 TaxID=2480796 RepID=UPI00103750DE|nr:hypothetical protein [Alteromonas sp. KUL17]TAP29801.1 hypothetical protein KUL49_05490 [Alteromonas sp. KUL17]GEA02197.1 hypothetical protein KUL17_10940 [Alteromonas sp. KUL17]
MKKLSFTLTVVLFTSVGYSIGSLTSEPRIQKKDQATNLNNTAVPLADKSGSTSSQALISAEELMVMKIDTDAELKNEKLTSDETNVHALIEPEESIDDTSHILKVNNDVAILDTKRLGSLTITELRGLVETIKFAPKASETLLIENELQDSLYDRLEEHDSALYREAVCNNDLCAIEVASSNLEILNSLVDDLMFDADIYASMQRGFVRLYSDDNQHFATFLGVRKGKASTVRIAN